MLWADPCRPGIVRDVATLSGRHVELKCSTRPENVRVRGFVSRLNCTTKAFHTGSTCVSSPAAATGRRRPGIRFAFTARRIAGNARGCLDIPLEILRKSSGILMESPRKDCGHEGRRTNLAGCGKYRV